MGKQTIEYCSLSYLNIWVRNDKLCVETLEKGNKEEKLTVLSQAGKFYRVAKNLPVKYDRDKGLKRYEPVLEILDQINPDDFQTDVVDNIRKVSKLISEQYGGRGVLSLTTKFLWLKIKCPIIIYDSQAQKALKTKAGDFEAFHTQWHIEFNKCKSKIEEACSNLPNLYKYMEQSNTSVTEQEVVDITSRAWFQERVFDLYLWNKGSN